MAFAIRNLSVLAYANGFTLWHYKAGNDPLKHIETLDFFADAADMLAEGDMMIISAADGGRVVSVASGSPVKSPPPLVYLQTAANRSVQHPRACARKPASVIA